MFANIAEDFAQTFIGNLPSCCYFLCGCLATALHLVYVCFGLCRGLQRQCGLHGGSAHFQNVKEVAIDRKNELNVSGDTAQRCQLMTSQQEATRSFLFAQTLSKHWLPPTKPLSLGSSRRRLPQSEAAAALPAAHLFGLSRLSDSARQREDPLASDGCILEDGRRQREALHHLVG